MNCTGYKLSGKNEENRHLISSKFRQSPSLSSTNRKASPYLLTFYKNYLSPNKEQPYTLKLLNENQTLITFISGSVQNKKEHSY